MNPPVGPKYNAGPRRVVYRQKLDKVDVLDLSRFVCNRDRARHPRQATATHHEVVIAFQSGVNRSRQEFSGRDTPITLDCVDQRTIEALCRQRDDNEQESGGNSHRSGRAPPSQQAVAPLSISKGGTASFIDAEHALDVQYAKRLGVDIDKLLISQPDTGEQALEIAEILVRSAAVDVVVIDSVAALVPKAEIEGEMGDAHMGLQARLMSQALRKLTATISKSNTIVILVNQIRMKIGGMFGNPETTTGGNALKFYSSVRLDIRRIASIKQGQDVIGSRTRVRVVKNKVAPPYKEVEFDLIHGEGISR